MVHFPLPDSLCKNKILRSVFKKEIENDDLNQNSLINYIQIFNYILQGIIIILVGTVTVNYL
jgi:hypothetical protein